MTAAKETGAIAKLEEWVDAKAGLRDSSLGVNWDGWGCTLYEYDKATDEMKRLVTRKHHKTIEAAILAALASAEGEK